ncbi:hypothetical protein DINM_007219 [Dirofilaria immitis]|nr:hypothetical protein [Dirofilaria immitis]
MTDPSLCGFCNYFSQQWFHMNDCDSYKAYTHQNFIPSYYYCSPFLHMLSVIITLIVDCCHHSEKNLKLLPTFHWEQLQIEKIALELKLKLLFSRFLVFLVVDILLDPEMRSTGEVMEIDSILRGCARKSVHWCWVQGVIFILLMHTENTL